jgi:hypothetical protein
MIIASAVVSTRAHLERSFIVDIKGIFAFCIEALVQQTRVADLLFGSFLAHRCSKRVSSVVVRCEIGVIEAKKVNKLTGIGGYAFLLSAGLTETVIVRQETHRRVHG